MAVGDRVHGGRLVAVAGRLGRFADVVRARAAAVIVVAAAGWAVTALVAEVQSRLLVALVGALTAVLGAALAPVVAARVPWRWSLLLGAAAALGAGAAAAGEHYGREPWVGVLGGAATAVAAGLALLMLRPAIAGAGARPAGTAPAAGPAPTAAALPATATRPRPEAGGATPSPHLSQLITQVPTMATAIVTIVGLVFLLRPNLKPKGTPVELSATVKDLSVESWRIDERQFLAYAPDVRGAYTDDAQTGTVVSFNLDLTGLAGERCDLVWSMYDGTTRQPYPEARYNDVLGYIITPHGDHSVVTGRIWVPFPPKSGPVGIRLDIYAHDGGRLASETDASLPLSAFPPTTPAAASAG